MEGGDIAHHVSSPSPDRTANSHASSAVAAVSVALVILYLLWRFIWQFKKGVRRNDNVVGAAASSVPPLPSCPSPMASEAERRDMTLLPVFVHVAAAGTEKAVCSVCLAEFAHGEAGRLVPGCGHGFHAACIETWFRVKSTCPLCRAAVAPGADARSDGAAPRG